MALEMFINPNKSSCIRFGRRYDAMCANTIAYEETAILWVKSVKYLGIQMQSSRLFKCVFDISKKSFYNHLIFLNAICGKIGSSATAEVVIHLLKVKRT